MSTNCSPIDVPFSTTPCSEDFDYRSVPSEDAAALKTHAERIRDAVNKSQRTVLRHVKQVGAELVAAQERLANHGDGTFARWCRDACGLRRTTVYKLIDAYRFAEDCPPGEQTFDISALYTLGAANCPIRRGRRR